MTYSPKFMKQYDSRWASHTYNGGSVTVGDFGCGPSCIANAVAALPLLHRTDVTIVDVFDWMSANGYVVWGGTIYSNPDRDGIAEGLRHFGLTDFKRTNSKEECRRALEANNWVIAMMDVGRWTANGHFILVYGIENNKMLVSDPASNTDYRQKDGPWDVFSAQSITFWILNNIAMQGATSNGNVLPISIDYSKISPYMVTIDKSSGTDIDVNFLKSSGVVAACIEAGTLFTNDHRRVFFRTPNVLKQTEIIKKAGIPWAYYFFARAQSLLEVDQEVTEFLNLAARYSPALGVWLNLGLTGSKSTNDKLIKRYQKRLEAGGFKGRIGFYVTRNQLDQITWKSFQNDWLLWIIDRLTDTSQLPQLLNPEFFDMDGEG